MDPGLSIQIIWPLAAEEAIAGEFEFIEPAHMLNAVLKFAELEDRQFKRMVDDDTIAGLLGGARNAVRAMLQEHAVDVPEGSAAIRRALRERMGQGGHGQQRGRIIHRSEAAREVSNAAEDVAQMAGERRWEAVHLLAGLLEAPGPRIATVLVEFGAAVGQSRASTPLLQAYGRDLTAEAREAERPADADEKTDPVCRVLLDELLGANTRSVLLVQTGERAPDEVLERLARLFVSDAPPKGSGGKRIIEISLAPLVERTDTTETLEVRLAGLLREAAEAGNVILWFSAFHRYFAMECPGLLRLLEQDFAHTERIAIVSMSEAGYNEYIKSNPAWKAMFHVVWIHETKVLLKL